MPKPPVTGKCADRDGTMEKVKIIATFRQPDDPSLQAFKVLVREIEQELGETVELDIRIPNPEACLEDKTSLLPAVFVGDFVKFCGILPDRESLLKAIKESGLE